MMSDETIDIDGSSFIVVAIRHGLLERQQADAILDYAGRENVQPSDAALTLSLLEQFEVDAINLLSRPSDLAPGYRLLGLIGCGAGGMVFRARQAALGRDVAIKTINLQSNNASFTGESRIQREAHAIARLQHPNIVAAYDSGFHQGRFCIAMELVKGENLASFIDREFPIDESIVWQIVRQVAHALAHANQAGIIHRDIKPANLLLTAAPAGIGLQPGVPFVKVADFGLALANDDRDTNQLTVDGATLGTPAYVAPEQLQDTHVDARADIYSLGASAFHMLTGKVPCADRSPIKTIIQKTTGDDRWRDEMPPTVSADSNALFRAMTEIDLDQRIQNYDELIERINHLIDEESRQTTSASSRQTSPNEITLLAPDPRSIARDPTSRRTDQRYPRHQRLAAVSIGLILLALAGYGIKRFNDRTPNSIGNSEITWQVDGVPEPLFNGESVPLFVQSGSWSPGITTDGSRVLVGTAGSKMTIPLARHGTETTSIRLRLGVLPAREGRVQLAISCGAPPRPIGTLHIENNSARFVPVGEPTVDQPPLPPSVNATLTDEFQRIQISRHGDQLQIEVNGAPLGSVMCEPGAPMFVVLRCESGDARFADIDIVALKQTSIP